MNDPEIRLVNTRQKKKILELIATIEKIENYAEIKTKGLRNTIKNQLVKIKRLEREQA